MDKSNKTIIREQTQPANQSRNNLTDYIRSKNDSWSKSDGIHPHKDYFILMNISVYVQKPLPSDIDLNATLQTVEQLLPQRFIEDSGVEMILIGQFEELAERQIQSLWKQEQGAIYITNEQDSNDDMIDDIIHEFAHAVEDRYGFELYSDDTIEQEFLQKRRHLYDILKAHEYEVSLQSFLQTNYNIEFDKLLYKEIGYEKLTFLTMGLFASPYAATSVREYFASAFEEFFLPIGDRPGLKIMSPAVYQKIETLTEQ